MWKLKTCFGLHNIRRCKIHDGHKLISCGVLAYRNRILPLCSLEELKLGQLAQLPIKSFCSLKVTQKSITYDSNRLGIFVRIVKLLNCHIRLSCTIFNLPFENYRNNRKEKWMLGQYINKATRKKWGQTSLGRGWMNDKDQASLKET